jgi:hypothetical protein
VGLALGGGAVVGIEIVVVRLEAVAGGGATQETRRDTMKA